MLAAACTGKCTGAGNTESNHEWQQRSCYLVAQVTTKYHNSVKPLGRGLWRGCRHFTLRNNPQLSKGKSGAVLGSPHCIYFIKVISCTKSCMHDHASFLSSCFTEGQKNRCFLPAPFYRNDVKLSYWQKMLTFELKKWYVESSKDL